MKNILIAVLVVTSGYFFWVLWVTTPDRTAMYQREVEVRQIVVEVSPLRPYVWDYYLRHGEFPLHLEALSFDPAAMRSKRVKQVSLGAGGEIIAQLSDTDAGRLWLSPTIIMDGMSIEWSCQTNISALAGDSCELSQRSDFPK